MDKAAKNSFELTKSLDLLINSFDKEYTEFKTINVSKQRSDRDNAACLKYKHSLNQAMSAYQKEFNTIQNQFNEQMTFRFAMTQIGTAPTNTMEKNDTAMIECQQCLKQVMNAYQKELKTIDTQYKNEKETIARIFTERENALISHKSEKDNRDQTAKTEFENAKMAAQKQLSEEINAIECEYNQLCLKMNSITSAIIDKDQSAMTEYKECCKKAANVHQKELSNIEIDTCSALILCSISIYQSIKYVKQRDQGLVHSKSEKNKRNATAKNTFETIELQTTEQLTEEINVFDKEYDTLTLKINNITKERIEKDNTAMTEYMFEYQTIAVGYVRICAESMGFHIPNEIVEMVYKFCKSVKSVGNAANTYQKQLETIETDYKNDTARIEQISLESITYIRQRDDELRCHKLERDTRNQTEKNRFEETEMKANEQLNEEMTLIEKEYNKSCLKVHKITKAELGSLLSNIDKLKETVKVTKSELDGLNERLKKELHSQPYFQYQSKLVSLLLDQHRNIVSQYNSEHQRLNSLKMLLFKDLEMQLSFGILSFDKDGKLAINKQRIEMDRTDSKYEKQLQTIATQYTKEMRRNLFHSWMNGHWKQTHS